MPQVKCDCNAVLVKVNFTKSLVTPFHTPLYGGPDLYCISSYSLLNNFKISTVGRITIFDAILIFAFKIRVICEKLQSF